MTQIGTKTGNGKAILLTTFHTQRHFNVLYKDKGKKLRIIENK